MTQQRSAFDATGYHARQKLENRERQGQRRAHFEHKTKVTLDAKDVSDYGLTE
jgi:hypothetical protein